MRWLLKQWWFWIGMVFILVVIVAGYVLVPVEDSRISRANCDRIRLGMTPAQVVSILGEHALAAGDDAGYLTWWDDDGNGIEVTFAGNRGVTNKRFRPTSRFVNG